MVFGTRQGEATGARTELGTAAVADIDLALLRLPAAPFDAGGVGQLPDQA